MYTSSSVDSTYKITLNMMLWSFTYFFIFLYIYFFIYLFYNIFLLYIFIFIIYIRNKDLSCFWIPILT